MAMTVAIPRNVATVVDRVIVVVAEGMCEIRFSSLM